MSKIRVEQIKDLRMWTDEEGVTHIQIGEDVITPMTEIRVEEVDDGSNEGDNQD